MANLILIKDFVCPNSFVQSFALQKYLIQIDFCNVKFKNEENLILFLSNHSLTSSESRLIWVFDSIFFG